MEAGLPLFLSALLRGCGVVPRNGNHVVMWARRKQAPGGCLPLLTPLSQGVTAGPAGLCSLRAVRVSESCERDALPC